MNADNINEIKARYKSSFVEKKKMIDDFRNDLVKISADQGDLFEQINADLHKLAGSLGMYGYSEMAEKARLGMKLSDNNEKQALLESLEALSSMLAENG